MSTATSINLPRNTNCAPRSSNYRGAWHTTTRGVAMQDQPKAGSAPS